MFLVFCCCSNTVWKNCTGLGQRETSHRCETTVTTTHSVTPKNSDYLYSDMTNVFSGHCRAPLGRTKLHDAADRGEMERVQRLLSTDSLNINSRNVIVSTSIMASVDKIIMYISHFNFFAVAKEGLTLTEVFMSPWKFEIASFFYTPLKNCNTI